MRELEVGKFYWIEPVRCVDIEDCDSWQNEMQPARYAGGGMFNLIGSEEPWPARYVHCEILVIQC